MKKLITAALMAAMWCTAASAQEQEQPQGSRLTIGGYGEATYTRMFYSNNYKRYTNAQLYSDAPSTGQFDLPHVTLNLGYDFGHGWKLGMEIEFEHGGTESAVEIEEEETGEYESEIERGGEVALEQFWIQKTFNRALNLRLGHIVVPVGQLNNCHMPNEYFTVFRPEGESTILPCTWHETGVSLWGRIKQWRYEVMLIAGLEADLFGAKNWIHDGSASPYEFKPGTAIATAARIDYQATPHLRLSMSGYVGNSASNSLKPDKYSNIKGTVTIGSFDFCYDNSNLIVRGVADYGHLSDSKEITAINKTLGNNSVSPQTAVASEAIAVGIEAGYNVFAPFKHSKLRGQQLHVFARYDYYDSMLSTASGVVDNPCWSRQKITAGVNYRPIKPITIKAEWSNRLFKSAYNNEPQISLGVTYMGLFGI
ncbi:MAG: hypothetical protein ACI308_01895 [Muribaculaceae bacterium]